jgi:hypothetical protein
MWYPATVAAVNWQQRRYELEWNDGDTSCTSVPFADARVTRRCGAPPPAAEPPEEYPIAKLTDVRYPDGAGQRTEAEYR